MRAGLNQYPPMAGVPALREAIAAKIEALYGRRYDPAHRDHRHRRRDPGDPHRHPRLRAPRRRGDRARARATTATRPNIELAGGTRGARAARRRARFAPDFDAHRRRAHAAHARDHRQHAAQPERHRLVGGRHAAAGRAAARRPTSSSSATRSTSTWCTTATHQSVARFPELAARSVVVSSFGKTYHVTGWKVGYVAAPAALSAEFRKVHQFNVFTVNTPMQHGARRATWPTPRPTSSCRPSTSAKRDLFRAGLARDAAARCCRARARYFQCVDYSAVSDLPRGRLLPLADDRDRRRRDPAVGLLRRRLRAAHRALLLRQEGRDARPALERLAGL